MLLNDNKFIHCTLYSIHSMRCVFFSVVTYCNLHCMLSHYDLDVLEEREYQYSGKER